MEIVVTGRHIQVSDRFRRHLEEKLAKVPQLAPRVQRLDVVVTHEPNRRQSKACERVEITCHVKGPVVRAEACADDQYAALDMALDKLLERLRRAQRPQAGAPRAARARVGVARRDRRGSPEAGGRGRRARTDSATDGRRRRRHPSGRGRLARRDPREDPRRRADERWTRRSTRWSSSATTSSCSTTTTPTSRAWSTGGGAGPTA